jgi:GNAT superfamily N-acetyltransferase
MPSPPDPSQLNDPSRGPPRPHRPTGSHGPPPDPELRVRLTRPEDIPAIITLSRQVYGPGGAWLTPELYAHQAAFPEGQLLIREGRGGPILGFAVTLIIDSSRFSLQASWDEITADGRLTTHEPRAGDTLYGAGIAVHPHARGRGIGRRLYGAREALTERLGLARIRAGARIPGYRQVSRIMDPFHYVHEVAEGIRRDPTLSFQLHMGFQVLGVALDYLPLDRESLGHAAVVEWTPGGGSGHGGGLPSPGEPNRDDDSQEESPPED